MSKREWAEAIGSWRRCTRRSIRERLPTRRHQGRPSSAATERARLEATLARVREGRRAIVFVTGEPGIGKTTLVETFLASEPAAARVGLGQCVEPYGRGDPYLPLIEALERLGRSEGGRSVADAMRRWAPTWLRQASALLDPAEREERARRRGSTTPRGMLRELAAVLEALTQERELIIWLEDVHWADASTLEAIAFLARRREPARLLLVASYRPVELGTADHPLLRRRPSGPEPACRAPSGPTSVWSPRCPERHALRALRTGTRSAWRPPGRRPP
jgi:predicted ATPase